MGLRLAYRLMVLLAVLLLPLFCLAKYERPVYSDKDLTKKKEACYLDIDNGLWGIRCRTSWIAKENCALRCVSSTCYSSVYEADPLEEGEIDFRRSRDFRACLRRELKVESADK